MHDHLKKQQIPDMSAPIPNHCQITLFLSKLPYPSETTYLFGIRTEFRRRTRLWQKK